MRSDGTSWLCPDLLQRQRLVEMEQTSRPAIIGGFLVVLVAFSLVASQRGWGALLFYAGAAAGWTLTCVLCSRVRRPEYWLLGADVWSMMMIGGCVAAYGGAHSPYLPLFFIPVACVPLRHGLRGTAVGGTAALLTIAAATSGLGVFSAEGGSGAAAMTLVVAGGVLLETVTLMRAELGHRGRELVDVLTGALNRNSLASRMQEIRQQAAITGASVGLITCDLDRFKQVNDTFGHPRGDRVLTEAVAAMRAATRTFEALYRIGGEEFLVLLPGADATQATRLAEDMRTAIAASRPGDLDVTASFGVSVACGCAVDPDRMLAEADDALYRAKHLGRNRVELAHAA